MRPDLPSRSPRMGRPHRDRKRAADRRARPARRRAALESLEPRTLLATLPSLTPAGDVAASTVSPRAGDESSPMVVASHNDPDKLVAVWTNANNPALANATTQIVAQAAFSNDGGQSWTPLNPGPVLSDPATSDPVLPFEEVRDASVAIDRNDRVYILTQQRSAGNDSGALVLTAFDFSGNSPTAVDLNPGGFGNFNAVYRWSTNPAFDPVVTVDGTVPSFTDPETGETVTNPGSGNVYISWISNDVIPALADPANFNPNRVLVAASSDGGFSFSAPQTLNDGGNFGDQRNAGPRLAVSQGTADGTIPAGQATVIWDDFGSGVTAVPPRDFIRTEQISTGAAANVSVSGVPIQDSPGDDIVVTTDVTITVTEDDIPDNFTSLSDLDFQVSLIHPGLDQISMTLIPPQASGRPSVTLVLTEDLDGDNLGFLDSGAVGTTFDDSASRRYLRMFLSEPGGHYDVLGVSPDASDAQLRERYRELVRENHPDRLAAKGVPQEFLVLADRKLAAINVAYDAIVKERAARHQASGQVANGGSQ